MTKLAQYTPMAREAFSNYLDNKIDLDTLIERLRYMELQALSEEEETGKEVWLRFFEGDSLQTTISEIEKDLSDPTHPGYRILIQGIAFGLQSGELEVHCS
ncbi:hypothetical protein [Pontibacter ruber]|uniref:Uncharacterized protein n=1 Tax=Pontibacter ruber TaxID=1343895 RepID=A0ABW5CT83_9BACT|nr:hypothetical protein [Pontibacter ruber]